MRFIKKNLVLILSGLIILSGCSQKNDSSKKQLDSMLQAIFYNQKVAEAKEYYGEEAFVGDQAEIISELSPQLEGIGLSEEQRARVIEAILAKIQSSTTIAVEAVEQNKTSADMKITVKGIDLTDFSDQVVNEILAQATLYPNRSEAEILAQVTETIIEVIKQANPTAKATVIDAKMTLSDKNWQLEQQTSVLGHIAAALLQFKA